jgi:protein BUR2
LQQIAAIAVFLTTKVDEMPRKLKEIVIACCRVAQKNPVLLVDEQTKDYWRWKDTIIVNEDIMLELLCFDLTLESPYKVFFDLMKSHGVSENKALRATGWAFINDSGNTQLCVLYPARTIACAALYCAAKRCEIAFPDDDQGRPWWEDHNVQGLELRKAYNHMVCFFEEGSLKPGTESIYVGGTTPLHGDEQLAKTRLRHEQAPASPDTRPPTTMGSESPKKRPRDDEAPVGNGFAPDTTASSSRIPRAALLGDGRESKRPKTEEPEEHHAAKETVVESQAMNSAGSEDGEVEE